ncbi:MAG: KH domain-containing protein [Polyangiaceae bacterium]|nr:KH domain-containing protein [Polyangiaceae bacterium]
MARTSDAPGEELSPLSTLVGLIARALVDHPDRVVVREVDGDHHPRIELLVAPEDIGKVIGKDGRTAQSIRTLLAAAAMRAGKRAHLDIVD